MAKKEFVFKGLSIEELNKLSIKDFSELIPSRQRRHIKRGWTEKEKKLMSRIDKGDSNIKTHCREMIIFPKMVGVTIRVHNGKGFEPVRIQQEMVGHCLGEFTSTRKGVSHSAPGVGATRSSVSVAVK
ncbi:30S ribosomal protein S19 [Candidatus Woesearchaeota archaeon]|nr:30S ribosomal protein S19 [Candidatus Woesearchaeota archaeon]